MSTTPDTPVFADRSHWLMGFGVLLLVMGAGCIAVAALSLVGAALMKSQAAGAPPLGYSIAGAAFYVLMGLGNAWLGVGSMACRRWARAFTLVTAAIWLFAGLLSLPAMVAVLPMSLRAGGAQVDAGAMVALLVITLAIMTMFLVVLPGMFVLVYRRVDVKATCERKDPEGSWTDGIPLRALALVLISGLCTVSVLLYGFLVPLPAFGMLVTGLPAIAAYLLLALLFTFATVGLARLKFWAWCLFTSLFAVMSISSALCLATGAWEHLYDEWNLPAEQLKMMRDMLGSPVMLGMMLAMLIVYTSYLLHVRKFFKAAAA